MWDTVIFPVTIKIQPIRPPQLDKMAKEGVLFTDAHSPSTICSPSRYRLFSGQQIYRSTGKGGGAFVKGRVDRVI